MASKYQIRADNEVLADLTHHEYAYYNGKLKRGVNIAGSLTFSLMPNNPVISTVNPLKTTIMLRRNGTTIWAGRAVTIKKNIYNQHEIICEGALSWLHDILIPPIAYSNTAIVDVVNSVINSYNSLCSSNRLFSVGSVDGEDIITISKKDGYTSVFDVLKEVITINGGYFILDYEQDGKPILNYRRSGMPTLNEVRFGENLLDINQHIDTTKIITALYATGDGVSLPAPGYIQNDVAVNAYGKIFDAVHFNNVTNQNDLVTQATNYLKQNMIGDASIKVKAVAIDWNANEGDNVRVISVPNGIDADMIVSEVVTDLNNETSGYITIGASRDTLTKTLALTNK